MQKFTKTLLIILILTFAHSLNVNAEDISEINDLIENAKELNGQEVTVQGEVIGERMVRGDYSWININDGTNAIGVWINKSEADKILYYGNYKNQGDEVRITGIFSRACVEHGGDVDLHNNSIEIVQNGHPVNERISYPKIITTSILSLFVLISLLFLLKTIKSNKATD
jgi:hypothetical protein